MPFMKDTPTTERCKKQVNNRIGKDRFHKHNERKSGL